MLGKKPIIGILGGLGAGKSVVAEQFGRLGCGIIKADEINHQVLREPQIVSQLLGWWGERILGADGGIDRGALGSIVFDDADELKKLTDLVHPMIFERIEGLIEANIGNPAVRAVVLDIPLLVELRRENMCDLLVFVQSDDDIRHGRLRGNRGWDKKKIKKIENLQIILDKKAKISEYTIVNNSNIPDLVPQIDRVLSAILSKADLEL